jgi:hypothetical protein
VAVFVAGIGVARFLELCARGGELFEHVGDVVFDGAGGERERVGDVLVGGGVGQEAGDFGLAR